MDSEWVQDGLRMKLVTVFVCVFVLKGLAWIPEAQGSFFGTIQKVFEGSFLRSVNS